MSEFRQNTNEPRLDPVPEDGIENTLEAEKASENVIETPSADQLPEPAASAASAQTDPVEVPDGAEAFSTVFSDPVTHKKAGDGQKKKKRLLAVIAALLAVAVLAGGTFAVVKLIPEKEDESENDSSAFETIPLLEGKSDDLKTVTVKNANGTFTLYSETETVKAEEEDGEDSENVTWYLQGVDKGATSSYSIESIASAAAAMSAIREITTKTAADCGLDNPQIRVDAVKKDGSSYTISIGEASPDQVGVYVRLSADDRIYLVDSAVTEDFTFDALSVADTGAVPGISTDGLAEQYLTDGALFSFDTITLSGARFPKEIVIAPNNNEEMSAYIAYVTLKPTARVADNDTVGEVFTFFQNGVTAVGAYSYDTSSAARAALGLDDPDFVLTMALGGKQYSYSFKQQPDGDYAVWYDDAPLIKKISADSLSFAEYTVNQFYSSWVCLQSINDLSAFTVKTGDKTYTFDVAYDGSEDAEETYVFTYEGKKLTAEYFQNFYQYCISLSCTDYTTEALTDQPTLSFVFTYSDTSKRPLTIDFVKATETKYQYSSNGTPMGKVAASSLNKVTGYLQKVIQDQPIN